MKYKNNQTFKAILITKGRKTGKEHSVWLRAVMYEDKLYFSRHKLDADWIKNAIVNPNVKVKFNDSSFTGLASLVPDESLAKKISELKFPREERSKEKRMVLEVILN